MQFQIELSNVQHIEKFTLSLDLSKNNLIGLVGRNGIGKTTLVRAARNLSASDTFLKVGGPNIFKSSSAILYSLDKRTVIFTYDPQIKSLNCRSEIPPDFRSLCLAELPIPDGARFNFFRSIGRFDREIRKCIALEQFQRPEELVEFLERIYPGDKFKSLVEIRIGQQSYFCILQETGKYIREDYMSSSEYFLIQLYKMITGPARPRLIVIDELDISLDAAAQIHLIRALREFCKKYKLNILFTTHSLAMMRKLRDTELFHMDGGNEMKPVSYSYLKSILFGFIGWDRYILTEDKVLAEFIERLIKRCCNEIFFTFKIIYIGGWSQVVDLLKRNQNAQFFGPAKNVIAILDGDQNKPNQNESNAVFYLPFTNVEAAVWESRENPEFPYRLPSGMQYNGSKDYYNSLVNRKNRLVTEEEVIDALIELYRPRLNPLVSKLQTFLRTMDSEPA